MELQVGQYVRTKTGIHQIYRIDNNKTKWKYVYKLKEQDGDGCINCGVLSSEDIIGEPSFEIIDLIGVGDYVNGQRVNYINKDSHYFTFKFGSADYTLKSNFNSDIKYLAKKDIKSIVTKEQFERMKCRIGE